MLSHPIILGTAATTKDCNTTQHNNAAIQRINSHVKNRKDLVLLDN